MKATLAALGCGAILVIVSCSMAWTTSTAPLLEGVGGPSSEVSVTGAQLVPAANAAGWVALAGILAVIATRSWGRTAVGVILVLAGVVIVVSTIGARGSTIWWCAAAFGGALTCGSGVVVAWRGRAWPGLSRRYVAPGSDSAAPSRARSPWDAIDHGHDPTTDDEPA